MIATLVVVRWSAVFVLYLLLNLILDLSDGTRHLQVAGRCRNRTRYHHRIQRHSEVSREEDDDDNNDAIDQQQSPYSYTWRWNAANLMTSVDAFEISQLPVAVLSQTPID